MIHWYIYVVKRSISLFQISTSLSESSFRVIVLSFEFDIEQDALMSSILLFFWYICGEIVMGASIRQGVFIREGHWHKFNIVKGKEAFIRQGYFFKRGRHLWYSTGQLNLVAGYDWQRAERPGIKPCDNKIKIIQ